MRLLLRWLIGAAALWVTLQIVYLIDPAGTVLAGRDRLLMMLLAALALGFVNAVIRPLLILLTLPLNCLTFGLFSFVINAAMFWLAGSWTGAYKVTWIGALIGSILMGIINGAANNLIVDRKRT